MNSPDVWGIRGIAGEPRRVMCSWCGATATRGKRKPFVRVRIASREGAACPRCKLAPTRAKKARKL